MFFWVVGPPLPTAISHPPLFSTSCLFAQVRLVQGVCSVEEEPFHSMNHNPIDKNTEGKNPTSANIVPRSSVWNTNWIRTTEFTLVGRIFLRLCREKMFFESIHSDCTYFVMNNLKCFNVFFYLFETWPFRHSLDVTRWDLRHNCGS